MSENDPRRRYDLTNKQVQAALDGQARDHVTLSNKVDRELRDMRRRLDAVYNAVLGVEGQGGLNRAFDEFRRERLEQRRERRDDWAIRIMAVGVSASVVIGVVGLFLHH